MLRYDFMPWEKSLYFTELDIIITRLKTTGCVKFYMQPYSLTVDCTGEGNAQKRFKSE